MKSDNTMRLEKLAQVKELIKDVLWDSVEDEHLEEMHHLFRAYQEINNVTVLYRNFKHKEV